MANPFDALKNVIRRRSAPDAPNEVNPFDTDLQQDTQLAYDPSQRAIIEPDIRSLGFTLPEDPNSQEFQDLLNQLKGVDKNLAYQTASMVHPAGVDQNDAFMAEASKRARNASLLKERWRDLVMVPNAQGDLVPNKVVIVGAALAVLGGAWVAVANSGHGKGPTTASADSTRDTNAGGYKTSDGSVITKLPNGDVQVVHPDGSSELRKLNGDVTTTAQDGTVTTVSKTGGQLVTSPNGASVQTLPDGSVVTRDPLGNILTNTPPTSTGTDQVNTSDLIQAGKALPSAQGTTIQHDPTAQGSLKQSPIGSSSGAQASAIGDTQNAQTPAAGTDSTDTATTSIGNPGTQAPAYAGQTYDTTQTYTPSGVSAAEYTAPAAQPGQAGPASVTGGTGSVQAAYTPTSAQTNNPAESVYTAAPAQSTGNATQSKASTLAVPAGQTSATHPPTTMTVLRSGTGTASQGSTGNAGTPAAGNTGPQYAYRKDTDVKITRITPAGTEQVAQTGPAATDAAVAPQGTGTPTPANTGTSPSGQGSAQYLRTASTPSFTRIVPVSATTPATATPASTAAPSNTSSTAAAAGYGALPAGSYLNTVQGGANAPAVNLPATSLPPTAANPYRLGQRMNAVMDTTVIATETGQSLPAYAHTADGTVWIGKTSLLDTKRIRIDFTRAVLKDGNVVSLNASAYGLDGAPGVEGRFQTLAPSLLNDLLRAGVSGVRDYVDAKIQATTTTTQQNGAQTVERQAPTVWESVAGSATKVFTLPPTTTTFVPVTTLQSGSPLVIINNPAETQ